MQCSFRWRCWQQHASYKWHFHALVLSTKLVIFPRYLWFHDIWVLILMHKLWSRIHWPNLLWNWSCIADLCQPFLRYSYFKMFPLNSKVNVMGEVKGWGHTSQLAQHPINIFPVCFMSMGPTNPQIWPKEHLIMINHSFLLNLLKTHVKCSIASRVLKCPTRASSE